MGQLNYDKLSERLSERDTRIKLVKHIFNTQGAAEQRLDYKSASAALNVSVRTISRYCDELADFKVIIFCGDKLKLNSDLISD